MQALLNGIVSAVAGLWQGVTEFFSWMRDHVGIVTGIACSIFITLAYQMKEWLSSCLSIKQKPTQLSGPDWTGFEAAVRGAEWADRLNYVLPVDDVLFIGGLLIALWASVAFWRLVKGLIF